MTKQDKWIGGVAFVALMMVSAILVYGPVALMCLSMWFTPLLFVGLAVMTFGVTLWLPKYMRTWQEWADNVKKFVKCS